MKFKFLGLLLLAVSLTACKFSETKKDDQIDPEISNEIHVLNNRIITGFVEGKPENILPVCSDRLLTRKGDVLQLVQIVQGKLKAGDFRILNEYYQKNAAKKHVAVVSSGKTGNHDYQIQYESLNKEMYVLVGYFEGEMNKKCFTFIYGKDGNKWKLNGYQAGFLEIMKKDAYDWYLSAKSNYQKGYLVDALCNIGLATQLLKPANHLWHYQKEKEILALEHEITKETYASYKFPLTLDSVETKPVIFRVYAEPMNDAYFPLILYITSVDLNDTQRLSKECNEIHEQIAKRFKGLTINNKIILYRPLKSIPTGTETTQQRGFMKKVE